MKRWDIEADCTLYPINASMNDHPDGDYVRYEDAAKLQRRLDAIIEEVKESETIVCPDCGGAGFWIAQGPGPNYVRTQPDGNHKVACEMCGGDFDNTGSGVIEPSEDEGLYARIKAIAEGRP